jgi:hypothetical protein
MAKAEAELVAQRRITTYAFHNRLAMVVVIALLSMSLAGLRCSGTTSLVFCVGASLSFLVAGIVGLCRNRLGQRNAKVLWIRRFHRGQSSRQEQIFLEQVVGPWGRLISIGDDAVRRSANARTGLYLLCLIVPVAVLGFLICVILGIRVPQPIVSGISLCLWATTKICDHGEVDLRKHDWSKKLTSSLRDRSSYRQAGVVFRCPPDTELWRHVIHSLTPQVDAVILSVPECTPALEWEIDALKEELGTEKMIVLGDHDSQITPALGSVALLPMPNRDRISCWLPIVLRDRAIWRAATVMVGSAVEFRGGDRAPVSQLVGGGIGILGRPGVHPVEGSLRVHQDGL